MTQQFGGREHEMEVGGRLQEIADRIRILRESKEAGGWTQAELADRSGVPRSMISDYESVRRKKFSRDVLAQLALALGTTVEFLLTGVGGGMVREPRTIHSGAGTLARIWEQSPRAAQPEPTEVSYELTQTLESAPSDVRPFAAVGEVDIVRVGSIVHEKVMPGDSVVMTPSSTPIPDTLVLAVGADNRAVLKIVRLRHGRLQMESLVPGVPLEDLSHSVLAHAVAIVGGYRFDRNIEYGSGQPIRVPD